MPAYNTYPYVTAPYPNGFTYSQMQLQPQMQQTQQMPSAPQSSLLTVFVGSEEEVNMYPVAAGITVLLINFNAGRFYLKSTGKNGVPEPIRAFSFTEDAEKAHENQNAEFVTRSDFEDLSAKLNDLIAKLGGDK